MSNSSAHDGSALPARPAQADLKRWLRKPIEVVGFWLAVSLPFVYLPLLVAGPLTVAERRAALALILVHAVTVVVGHAHRPD